MNRLSIVIPCFNEEKTLEKCLDRVLKLPDNDLSLEIIIVDDASTDQSLDIAKTLEAQHREIRVFSHRVNQGKGAALRTGFSQATGDFVAVQDADLEYNPMELKKLVAPLAQGYADVVLGSRFLSTEPRRVLYFWHSMGNKFLTFISNMFTDLNLTDMETCYKVFKREVIQSIEVEESRFGVEPELVAKLAHMRLRIYELGISYKGRTYEEGKKIGIKDGFRAIYCIFRYNAHRASLAAQFLLYLLIGGSAAVVNLACFLLLFHSGVAASAAAPAAFILAAGFNYVLCISFLFRHRARWSSLTEILVFMAMVAVICWVDLKVTQLLLYLDWSPVMSKLSASALGLVLNFLGRRFMVFPEPPSGDWMKNDPSH